MTGLRQTISFVSSFVHSPAAARFHANRVALCGGRNTRNRSSTTMSAEASPVASGVAASLRGVRDRIAATIAACGRDQVQLVAVSKTKPVELLMEAYEAGQRYFGENYVQELVAKAPQLPVDVKWHFIGGLQSNKAKILVEVPNLYMVESVDREKTASALNKAVSGVGRSEKLKVMVQVNTSGEESKSGCEPGKTAGLAEFVEKQCEYLELVGLMTIGAPDTSEEPEAFKVLAREREAVAERLGRETSTLSLSMGMSGDFEAAIRMGSDSVRVGSTIFGARDYSNK